MKHLDLAEFIDKHLPEGMYSYMFRPRKIWHIHVVNEDHSEKYFSIEIDPDLELSQQKTSALNQINKFKELWESPLAKAMREED